MSQPSPSKKPLAISRGYKFKLDPTSQRESHLEAATPDRKSPLIAAGKTLTSKAVKPAPPPIDGED